MEAGDPKTELFAQLFNHQSKLILNSMGDGVYCFDLEGKTTFVNLAAANMLGFSIEELMGENLHDIVRHSKHDGTSFSREECPIALMLATGHEQRVESEVFWRRNNTHFPVAYTSTPIITKLKTVGGIVVFRDIADRKKMEEETLRLTADLKRSNLDLETFAGNVSHDLRNPLRKVLLFGDRLRELADNLEPEGEFCLERMQRAIERMQNLIDAILDFSGLDPGPSGFGLVDLRAVVAEVMEDLQHYIEQSEGSVKISQNPPLPSIEADRLQMYRLLQNLIGNALKFYKKGDVPVVKVRAELASSEPAAWNIFVEDNGVGFQQKNAERIFQPLARLHGTGAFEGHGLGLAICERIVKRHGGSIAAKSQPNQGATFIITLPEKQSKKDPHIFQ